MLRITTRSASATIKGFTYQFKKSLYKILDTDDCECTFILEGLIEDLDIVYSDEEKEGIQYKYYESSKAITSSDISMPILQMISTMIKLKDSNIDVKYELIVYCREDFNKSLEYYIDDILNTNNKELIVRFFGQIYEVSDESILEKIDKKRKTQECKDEIYNYFKNKNNLKLKIEKDKILEDITLIKGESIKKIDEAIINKLSELLSVDKSASKKIYYPNAFVKIADKSSNTDVEERVISKKQLLKELKIDDEIITSKWLKEFFGKYNYIEFIKTEELNNLDNSKRRRLIIINRFQLNIKTNDVCKFIIEFVDKYYYSSNNMDKLSTCGRKLKELPLFIILDSIDSYWEIENKLNNKGLLIHNGFIGGNFKHKSFGNRKEYKNKNLAIANFKEDELESVISQIEDLRDIYCFGEVEFEGLKEIYEDYNFKTFDFTSINFDDMKRFFLLN